MMIEVIYFQISKLQIYRTKNQLAKNLPCGFPQFVVFLIHKVKSTQIFTKAFVKIPEGFVIRT